MTTFSIAGNSTTIGITAVWYYDTANTIATGSNATVDTTNTTTVIITEQKSKHFI